MKSDFIRNNENATTEYNTAQFVPDGKSGPFRWHTVTFGDALLNSVSRPAVPVAAIILIVYLCTGNWAEALLILAILAVTLVLSAFLTYRSGQLYSDMCRNLVAPSYVRRDGRNCYVKWYDIREDDVILLSAGTVLPADVMLVSGGKVRVLEQYFDYDTNKRALRRMEKIPSGNSDGLSDEKSLIYAGSTIISGSGRGAVIALGADTEISKRLGGIKIAPSDFRTPTIRKNTASAKRISDLLLLLSIIATVVYLIVFSSKGGKGIGLLPFTLTEMSLIIASLGKNTGGIYDYLMLDEYTRASSDNEDGIHSFGCFLPGRSDDISEADTLLILEHSAIADLENEVRAAFFNSTSYSGRDTGSGDLTGLSEKALLLKTVRTSSLPENGFDTAFERFADVQNADPDYLLNNVSGIRSKVGYPGKDDVSAFVTYKSEKEKSETVTGTFDTSILGKCRFYRDDNESLLPCDLAFSDAYTAFLEDMDKRCLTPVVITSCASGGDMIVLEGILAVGGMFPEVNGEVTRTLGDYGIHTVAVIPEDSEDSAFAAKMCGLAEGEANVAVCSEYKKSNTQITDAFDSINVFSGFGTAGTEKICNYLKENGRKTVAVVGDGLSMKYIPDSAVAISVRENTSGAVNLRCAATVRPASEYSDYTGINAVLSLIFSSVCCRFKNIIAEKFFIFKTAFLISAFAIPVISGWEALVPGSFAVLIASLFADLCLVLSVRCDGFITKKLEISKGIYERSGSFAEKLITLSMGVLSALCMTATGVLQYRTDTSVSMNGFVLISLLAVPLAFFGGMRLFARLKMGLVSVNIPYIIFCLIAVLLCFGCILLPQGQGILASLTGVGMMGYRLLWLCGIPAIFSAAVAFASGFIPTSGEKSAP